MKDQRKTNIKTRGFLVKIEERGTNEQWEGKECETRSWEYEKPHSTKTFMKLVWKTHEVVRGKVEASLTDKIRDFPTV